MDNSQVQVEYLAVDDLKEYEKNAKVHSKEQIEKLAASIRSHGGIANPLNIEPDGTIITGHGRRMAAKLLGMTKVPAIVRHDLSPEQRRALRLADNKTASIDYDSDLLSLEIKELSGLAGGIDHELIESMGYSDKELAMLTEDLGEVNVEAFVSDISEQTQQQQQETQDAIDEADTQRVPLVKAFGGIKDVSVADSREIKCFMAVIESDTGLTGAAALMSFIKELNKG